MPVHSIAQILRYHIADIKIAQICRYHKTGRPQTEVLPVSFSVISDSLLSQILFCCVFTAATDSLLLRDPLLLRILCSFRLSAFSDSRSLQMFFQDMLPQNTVSIIPHTL